MAKAFEKLLCLVCNYSISADKKGNYTCPCCGMSFKSKILKDKRFALISEMIDSRMSGDFEKSSAISAQLSQLSKDYSVISKWNSYLCSIKVVLNSNGYFISDRLPKGTKPNVDNLRFQEFCQDAFKNDRAFCGSASVIQIKIKEYFEDRKEDGDFANPSVDTLPIDDYDIEITKNNSITLLESNTSLDSKEDDDDIIDDDIIDDDEDYILEEVSADEIDEPDNDSDVEPTRDVDIVDDSEVDVIEQIDDSDQIVLEETVNESSNNFADVLAVDDFDIDDEIVVDVPDVSLTDTEAVEEKNSSSIDSNFIDELDIEESKSGNSLSNDELDIDLDTDVIDDIDISKNVDASLTDDELDIADNSDIVEPVVDESDPLEAAKVLIESEIVEDRKAGFELIKNQAKLGLPNAMFLYGYCWEKGICVLKNCKNALSWYKKASASGIECSEDVSRMEKEVVDKIAKQTASSKSKNSVDLDEGIRFYNRKDYDNAFAIFKRATESKNKNAYFYYAICLEYGLGCEVAPEEAFNYYSQAVKSGDDNALYYLAQCYLRGFGCEPNAQLAYKYFKKSADNGNAKAEYRISLCYKQGIGVEVNMKSAFKWALSAAQKGVLDAINDVAWYYVSGTGTKKDYDNAFKWFKEGSSLGDANAMYNLAICYEQGYGVDQNIDEAIKWYRKSSRLGSTAARKRLKQIK